MEFCYKIGSLIAKYRILAIKTVVIAKHVAKHFCVLTG